MAKEKEKKVRQKINWKKEMKLAPGYIVIKIGRASCRERV